jgi:hypothetical protein
MANYKGSISILDKFLLRAKTYDPYLACQRMELTILNKDEIPVEQRIPIDQEDSKKKVVDLLNYSVAGLNGRKLNCESYLLCAIDPLNKSSIAIAKDQAFGRIYGAFGPAEKNRKFADIRPERQRSLKDATRELAYVVPTLEDLIGEELCQTHNLNQFVNMTYEDLICDKNFNQLKNENPAVAADLRRYIGLKEVLSSFEDNSLRDLGSLFKRQQNPESAVLKDQKGEILKWYENNLKNPENNLPDYIKEAYLRYTRLTNLSTSETSYLAQALFAYFAENRPVATKIIKANLNSDLNSIKKLVADFDNLEELHPLKASGISSAKFEKYLQAVENNLEGQADEISLAQGASILNGITIGKMNLRDLRVAINKYEFKNYSEDFSQALRYFRSFFQDKENLISNKTIGSGYVWKEDCIAGSIPQRLSEGLYGMTYGTGVNSGSVLVNRDWRAIYNAIRISEAATEDQNAFYASANIELFKNTITSAIFALRKAKKLELELRKLNLMPRATEVIEPDELKSRLEQIPEKVCLKSGWGKKNQEVYCKYVLAEELNLPLSLGNSAKERLAELALRISAQAKVPGFKQYDLRLAIHDFSAGYCFSDYQTGLEQLALELVKLQKLTEAEQQELLSSLAKIDTSMGSHRLNDRNLRYKISSAYLEPETIEELGELAKISTASKDLDASSAVQASRVKRLLNKYILTLDQNNKLVENQISTATFASESAEELVQKLAAFEQNFVRADVVRAKLGHQQFVKLVEAFENYTSGTLNSEYLYISTETIEKVTGQSIETRPIANAPTFAFVNLSGQLDFVINNQGEHKGKSVTILPAHYLSFLASPKASVSPLVKDIAAKILRIRSNESELKAYLLELYNQHC